MLVVAADDGVMPQTREHLEILTLLGVRHGFVALTKIDRVDARAPGDGPGRRRGGSAGHVPGGQSDSVRSPASRARASTSSSTRWPI